MALPLACMCNGFPGGWIPSKLSYCNLKIQTWLFITAPDLQYHLCLCKFRIKNCLLFYAARDRLTLSPEASMSSVSVGGMVMARWGDRNWYPANVLSEDKNGK